MAKLKLGLLAAAALGAIAFAAPASAAPPTGGLDIKAASPSTVVTDVQYRRIYPRYYSGYRYGYGPYRTYRRGPGPWPFIGFGAAVAAGAIIANSYYAPRRNYVYYDAYDYNGPYYYPTDYRGDPRTICARYFRSFEWDTGLYTTFRGEKRMCPYLGV